MLGSINKNILNTVLSNKPVDTQITEEHFDIKSVLKKSIKITDF